MTVIITKCTKIKKGMTYFIDIFPSNFMDIVSILFILSPSSSGVYLVQGHIIHKGLHVPEKSYEVFEESLGTF